jgi:hypothetical protein
LLDQADQRVRILHQRSPHRGASEFVAIHLVHNATLSSRLTREEA